MAQRWNGGILTYCQRYKNYSPALGKIPDPYKAFFNLWRLAPGRTIEPASQGFAPVLGRALKNLVFLQATPEFVEKA
jgi:hypothetical protein